jgi:putative flippase GtrA
VIDARARGVAPIGVRRPAGLGQLLAFCVVGASGYVVNLAVFTALVALGSHFRVAACGAFVVAVANNYAWNRKWTFSATRKAIMPQAARFFGVSLVGFGASLAFLSLLVAVGVAELPAQAGAIVLATPVSFLGNKVWSFR